jgi:hypothetical protein
MLSLSLSLFHLDEAWFTFIVYLNVYEELRPNCDLPSLTLQSVSGYTGEELI